MFRCPVTTGMPRWRGQHDLKLVWLCWSPPSSPPATGSASIPRTGNIWNEFEGLRFNSTRSMGEGLDEPLGSPDPSHSNFGASPMHTQHTGVDFLTAVCYTA